MKPDNVAFDAKKGPKPPYLRHVWEVAGSRKVEGTFDYLLIYLTNPHKVDGNKLVDTGFSGILITPEMKIEYIEFLKDPKEQLERR